MAHHKDDELEASENETLPSRRAAERSLLRKIDRCILPILCGFYLLQGMDKGNLSYARLAGLDTDTNLSDGQYSWVASIFYVGYIISEIPSNMLSQKLPLAKWLSFITIAWGIALAATAGANNFTTLMISRFFLGIFEAGILPGSVLMTSLWYKRHEVASRTAIWFCFSSLSGLVGAAAAVGLSALKGKGGLEGWRWIMLIEGLVTVLWGIIGWFFLPDIPEKARFLNEVEREAALDRLRENKAKANQQFKMYQAIEAAKDYKTWMFALIYLCISVPNAGISSFASVIANDFGFSTTVSTLLTGPYSLIAMVITLVVSFSSDHFRDRAYHIFFSYAFASVGLLIVLVVNNKWAILAGFYMFAAFAAAMTLTLAWMSNSTIGHTKRIVTSAIVILVGNIGSIIGPQLFIESDAPRYQRGNGGSFAFTVAAAVLTLILRFLLSRENQRRDRQALTLNMAENSDDSEAARPLDDKQPQEESEADTVIDDMDLTDWENKTFRYFI